MFHNRSLQFKLIFSFTTIFLVSFLVIVLCFYGYIHNYIEKDNRQSMEDITRAISNQLDSEVYNLDRIALGMLGNKEFVDGLTLLQLGAESGNNSQFLEKYQYQKLVDKLIFTLNTPILTSPMISVFDPEKNFFFAWDVSGLDWPAIGTSLHTLSWEDEVRAQAGGKVLLPPRQNEWSRENDSVFSVSRAVMTSKGTCLGLLEVQQRFSVLENLCKPQFNSWLTVVIDSQGHLIYPLSPSPLDSEVDFLAGEAHGQGELRLESLSETYFYSSVTSEYTHWKTVILRPKRDVFKATALLSQFIFTMVLMILTLSLTAVVILSKTITRPIRRLRCSIEEMDVDQLDIALDTNVDNDEIYLLNRTFEQLIQRIDLSVKQRVQAQQEEARAYLLALQSQMNPHFLYNTLNTISVLAEEKDEVLIAKTCQHLVGMLRYVSDYNHPRATLAEELLHTRQYLSLLKTRFEDQLSFELVTQGKLEEVTVPKLILQPLVENCYKHGLSAVFPPWQVQVEVSAFSDTHFQLVVSDNGCGFSPQALAEINSRISSFCISNDLLAEIKNINLNNVGLFNTYSRLFLEYGDAVTLSIANREPCGSTVTITIQYPDTTRKENPPS